MLPNQEIDFPRGKLPSSFEKLNHSKRKRVATAEDQLFPSKYKRKANDGGQVKGKTKRGGFKSKNKSLKAPDDTDEKIRIEPLTLNNLPIGLRVMATVQKMSDYEIFFVIPGGIIIPVPLYNISDAYSSAVESFMSDPSCAPPNKPVSMFSVGQSLPVKIIEIEDTSATDQKKKGQMTRFTGSINPKDIYEDVLPSNIVKFASKIIISASVVSLEDHGYIMDIGMGKKMTAFLPKEDAAKYYLKKRGDMKKIPVGTVLLCAGVSCSSSNVLKLTTNPKSLSSHLVTGDEDILSISSVMPGMRVSIRVMDLNDKGLKIMAANEHLGYVYRDHLNSEWDMARSNYSISDVLMGTVLYVHPLTRIVVCSLRDVPTEALVQKKFGNVKVGQLVKSAKIVHIDDSGCLILKAKNGMKLFASSNQLTDTFIEVEKIPEQFPVGSKHDARIQIISYYDLCVRVTLKPSIVEMESLALEDLSIGSVIKGKVKKLTDDGLVLNLGYKLNGFVRNIHFSDVPAIAHPEKLFQLGKEVSARVLQINSESDPPKINLTCKKSLLAKKLNILDSLDKAVPGFKTIGVVVLSNNSGVLVEFFAGLKGWISRILLKNYDIESSFRVGQLVTVYVLSCDPAQGRISLSLNSPKDPTDADQTLEHPEEAPKGRKRTISEGSEASVAHGKFRTGSIVAATVKGFADKGSVILGLEDESVVIVPNHHLVDKQSLCTDHVQRMFEENQKVKCRVFRIVSGRPVLTMKPSLLDERIVAFKDINKVQLGSSTIGVIDSNFNGGKLVEFLGGLRGVIRKQELKKSATNPDTLLKGCLVSVRIHNVDKNDKKIDLSIVAEDEMADGNTSIIANELMEGFHPKTFKKLKSGSKSDKSVSFVLDTEPKTCLEDLSIIYSGLEDDEEDSEQLLRPEPLKAESPTKRATVNVPDTAPAEKDAATVEEHEKNVESNPNSSSAWLKYMMYLLDKKLVDETRAIGNQALATINYREEEEKFNIWVALINLEHKFGDEETLKAVMDKALQAIDQLKIYSHVAKMYHEAGEIQISEETYQTMVKKFKNVS